MIFLKLLLDLISGQLHTLSPPAPQLSCILYSVETGELRPLEESRPVYSPLVVWDRVQPLGGSGIVVVMW